MFSFKGVVATTVLHNMCIKFANLIEYKEDNGDDDFDHQFVEKLRRMPYLGPCVFNNFTMVIT